LLAVPVAVQAATDLGITNYAFTDPTARGSIGTFTVRATNFGLAPITDAVITIHASPNFTIDPSSLPSGLNCSLAGSTITCAPGSLPVGDTVITYAATAATVGSNNTDASISRAARADYEVIRRWDLLAEVRKLSVTTAQDSQLGALVAVYRHLGPNVKVGVGYNFTDYSDDLSDLSHRNHGFFFNVIGKF
jgi:hypothetical protein